MGKTWAVGDVLTAADMNEWAGGTAGTRYASKVSDTTRSSTAVLASDPDLTLPVDASKTYMLELWVRFTSNGTANFQYELTGPAGASLNAAGVQFITTGSAATTITSVVLGTPVLHVTGQGTDAPVRVSGTLVTGVTAGSLTFLWAQDTSNASNTIVRAGSSMLLRRVA